MSHPFTHLHVASGYSLRYGASTPAQLVETAAAAGMHSLALTDRDGLYGAVKFVLACEKAKIHPVLGVDLAVEPSGLTAGLPAWAEPAAPPRRAVGARVTGLAAPVRSPVRGGATVDARFSRVTVLALAGDQGADRQPGEGWGQLCRLVTATHLRGERSRPVSTIDFLRRPAIGLGAGAAHQHRPLAVAQAVGLEEGLDGLLVVDDGEGARPVRAPQAAVETPGIEHAGERIPDVRERIRLVATACRRRSP